MFQMSPDLIKLICCPYCKSDLSREQSGLKCNNDECTHNNESQYFRIINGKPILNYDQVMQLYHKKYYQKDHIDDWVKHHESWFTKERVLLYIIILLLLIVFIWRYHKAIAHFFKKQFQSSKTSSYY